MNKLTGEEKYLYLLYFWFESVNVIQKPTVDEPLMNSQPKI